MVSLLPQTKEVNPGTGWSSALFQTDFSHFLLQKQTGHWQERGVDGPSLRYFKYLGYRGNNDLQSEL